MPCFVIFDIIVLNTKTMLRLRSAAIVLGLLIPVATLAAPPSPVTGLSGVREANGEVRIEWQPSQDSAVVRYRLYYSSESILESEGVYDDFEETEGTENTYVFTTPPTTRALYVTVLAVNNMGEESDAFVEEVKVDLAKSGGTPRLETASSSSSVAPWAPVPQPQPEPPVLMIPESSSLEAQSSSAQASIPTYAEPAKDGGVHLLLAEALSPIQVKLTFSDPVQIDAQSAPQAFAIQGPDGTPLRIVKLLLSEQIVVLDTEQQQKGLVYNVKLTEPIQGINGEPLDATNRSAFFTGHDQGLDASTIMPQQPVVPVYDPMHPADVTGFSMRAAPEAGGTYTITATWQADISRGDIAHYVVKQSLDGGRVFGEPQMIPMDVAGVEFIGVQPGMFGISLQVMNVYGGTSAGVFDSVTLGNGAVLPPVIQGSVSSTAWQGPASADLAGMLANADAIARTQRLAQVRSRNLPDSGLGLVVVGSSLVGACAGWRKARKLRMEN